MRRDQLTDSGWHCRCLFSIGTYETRGGGLHRGQRQEVQYRRAVLQSDGRFKARRFVAKLLPSSVVTVEDPVRNKLKMGTRVFAAARSTARHPWIIALVGKANTYFEESHPWWQAIRSTLLAATEEVLRMRKVKGFGTCNCCTAYCPVAFKHHRWHHSTSTFIHQASDRET